MLLIRVILASKAKLGASSKIVGMLASLRFVLDLVVKRGDELRVFSFDGKSREL